MPDQFYERPEIAPHLSAIWMAFAELSTERQIGMVLGPIPVSKIKTYLREELDLVGDDLDRALSIIRLVDADYQSLAAPSKNDPDDERLRKRVKANDPEGVRKLMSGIGKKPKKTKT